jgi:trehalose 6-phosphate phosphatase
MLPGICDLGRYAIFLDLDGTIVELAERPDAVQLSPPTLRLLQTLHDKSGRALAVISGRQIAVVDRLLQPLVLPAAGEHGSQRRDASGVLHSAAPAGIEPVTFVIEKSLGDEPGVIIERKGSAVALHYRLRPDLERRCCEIVHEAIGRRPDLRLIHGKMVFEIVQESATKGRAIAAFMAEPPFSGRTPIFAGDDATDEAGFALVNSRGGVSIKVGADPTGATFRAESVEELHDWLWGLADLSCKDQQ